MHFKSLSSFEMGPSDPEADDIPVYHPASPKWGFQPDAVVWGYEVGVINYGVLHLLIQKCSPKSYQKVLDVNVKG